jgi:hypothetical protein
MELSEGGIIHKHLPGGRSLILMMPCYNDPSRRGNMKLLIILLGLGVVLLIVGVVLLLVF